MTTSSTSDPGPGPAKAGNGSHTGTRARTHRMPVMGWIREIATSGNRRTDTIVRRRRDRAATPGPV